jgi:hypothetical protein
MKPYAVAERERQEALIMRLVDRARRTPRGRGCRGRAQKDYPSLRRLVFSLQLQEAGAGHHEEEASGAAGGAEGAVGQVETGVLNARTEKILDKTEELEERLDDLADEGDDVDAEASDGSGIAAGADSSISVDRRRCPPDSK